MATRSSRRATNAELPQLNHIESLLIAQGAWEMGTGPSTWPAIAKILSKHPLVTRPKAFFTAQFCHAIYDHLIQDAGLESNEESSVPQSATNLALAQKYFQLRREELHELILAEENAFKTVLKEIEEIKAGKWDAKIKTNLTGQVADGSRPTVGTGPGTGGDEPFSGSDLSGVTETSSPSLARGDSETPTLKPNNGITPEEAPGSTSEETPGALTETHDMEVEEGAGPEETPTEDTQEVDQPVEAGPTDAATTQVIEKDTEPLRQEEEEEEEETTASKSEEEETDREGGPAKESPAEPITEVKEHQPEEEEEEEDAVEPPQEDEAQEDEDQEEEVSPQEDEPNTPPALSEESESPEETEQQVEEAEEEAASDEEPAQMTRRSTRNRPAVPTGPALRKTRRQRRASEPDFQSPAIEGEPADMDETKTETSQEEDQASSPAPAEPIGVRRSKRKGSGAENVESPRDRKRQRDESEPVDDDEPGPSSTGQRRRRGDRSEEQVASKRFQNVIGMLHSQISQHRNGNIFHNPIRTVEAPDYHDIVKRPMDLKTIKGRVKDGLITNSLEYQRDIFLMFANSMMYNRPGSDVFHMAEDMMHESEVQIKAFRQTEGLVRGRP